MSKVIGFIPAKGISRRLPQKNKRNFLGKPLISWTLAAAKRSKLFSEIYVSTEDPEIKNICLKMEVKVVDRPLKLSLGEVGKQDVLEHAIPFIEKDLGELFSDDIFCMLQANSPQITTEKIDEAVKKVVDSDGEVYECISMNKDTLSTDGAIRVFRHKCANNRGLGMYLSAVLTDYVDVHTIEDLKTIERAMKDENSII